MTLQDLPSISQIEQTAYPQSVWEGEIGLGTHYLNDDCPKGGAMVAVMVHTGLVVGHVLCQIVGFDNCPFVLETADLCTSCSSSVSSQTSSISVSCSASTTLYLHDISILPSYRSLGIGTLLLQHVQHLGQQLNLTSITLTAVCGAWGYWLRLGFVELMRKSDALKVLAETEVIGVEAEENDDLLSKEAMERLIGYPEACGDVRLMRRSL